MFKPSFFLSLMIALFISTGSLRARSYFQEAKYAFSMGNWSRAYTLFEKASTQRPGDGAAFFYMGYTREQQGRKGEAIPNYEESLKLKLEDELREKSFWKIVLYYKEKRNWERLLHYSTEFLSLRNIRSVQKLKGLAEKNYDPRQRELGEKFQEAKKYKRSDDPSRAIHILEKLIASQPGHIEARWELALLYMKQKKFYSASNHLKLLQSGNPKDWRYHYKSAVCNYHLEDYEEAAKDIKKAKEVYSGNSSSFQFYTNYISGNVHIEKENFKLALQNLNKAKKIQKEENLDLITSLAHVHWHLGHYKKAKSYAQKAAQKESQEALAFLILAMCHWRAKKNKEAYAWAKKMYSALLEENFLEKEKKSKLRKYAPGFLLLGQEAVLKKNWRQAIVFYKKTKQGSIDKIRKGKLHRPFQKLGRAFHYNFATSLMYNKQAKEALKHYARAEKKEAELFYMQARCYALLLQGQKAKEYLEKALKSKGEFWERAHKDRAFQDLMEQDFDFQEFMKEGPS